MGTHIKLESQGNQQRRNQDLPQFLSHHNRCLYCAGDHQTKDCATAQQWQTPTTNSPASGTDMSWPENQGILFFYISKTLQMNRISLMAFLLNAVL